MAAAVSLVGSAWRKELETLARAGRQSVLVAVPYIKRDEAAWFCECLRPGVELIVMANISLEAVGSRALDLTALELLAECSPRAKLIALPNLHAKVFIADGRMALITSGNLTFSAFNRNIEYGVLLRQGELVRKARGDMLAFTRLGSEVEAASLAELVAMESDIRQAAADLRSSAKPSAKRKFDEVMGRSKPVFAAAQVGDRSAHAVFGEAIQFVLERGPQTTKLIQREVAEMLPALCDESDYFYIRGERYGRTWKRRFRHAQLHLKRKGVLAYDTRTKMWRLANSESG